MKILLLICFIPQALNAAPRMRYPYSPDFSLTPGDLCQIPSEYRYPERIAYCERDVNFWQKEIVFINYRKIGYSLSGERNKYKIDHFIPLCLGGSNELTNLWPQYFTVSEKTDPLEPIACAALAKGKITQREVIDLIMSAKLDLTKVPATIKRLKKLSR